MLSERTIDRLRDIVEDAARISIFLEDMALSEFLANEKTIFAVERLLQRITEAAIQITSRDMTEIGAVLPIAQMRALGKRLRHEYRDINRKVIFEIAQIEIPVLSVEVELLLGRLDLL